MKVQKVSIQGKPVVSVITVVYNGEKYLEKTIQSVITQTYDNMEYIIIDGGSTDGTLDIIQKYEAAVDYWISEPDEGIFDAMNKGIVAASGEYINLLNCGDCYADPHVVGDYVREFHLNPDRAWIFAKAQVIREDGSAFQVEGRDIIFGRRKVNKFLSGVCHQTVFYRKNLHDSLGLYSLKYKDSADHHFLLRLYHVVKEQPVFFNKITVMFGAGGNSSSIHAIMDEKRVEDEVLGKSVLNELKFLKAFLLRSFLQNNLFGKTLLLAYRKLKYRMVSEEGCVF